MELKYNISKEDYINFNRSYLATSPSLKSKINIQRYGIPIIYILLAIVMSISTKQPMILWIGAFGIVSVLWIIYYPKYVSNRMVKMINKTLDEGENKGIIGDRIVSFSEKGVVEKTEAGESKTTWQSIEKVIGYGKYIYIYVSSMSAYIIPLNNVNFSKEDIVKELKNYIDDYKIEILEG